MDTGKKGLDSPSESKNHTPRPRSYNITNDRDESFSLTDDEKERERANESFKKNNNNNNYDNNNSNTSNSSNLSNASKINNIEKQQATSSNLACNSDDDENGENGEILDDLNLDCEWNEREELAHLKLHTLTSSFDPSEGPPSPIPSEIVGIDIKRSPTSTVSLVELTNVSKPHPSSNGGLEILKKVEIIPELFDEPDIVNKNVIYEVDENNEVLIREGQAPVLKGATLVKLVERLTHHEYGDAGFIKQCLLTYPSFTEPFTFFRLLMMRFQTTQRHAEAEETSLATQARVLNVVRKWVEGHFGAFRDDPELLGELQAFVAGLCDQKNNITSQGHLLQRLVSSKVSPERNDKFVYGTPPEAIKHGDHIYVDSLLQCDPLEVARQITLFEFDLYASISGDDLSQLACGHSNKATFLALSSRFDCMAAWVIESLLNATSPFQRLQRLIFFINVGTHCLVIQNFNAVFEIVTGLYQACIKRLKSTFACLPSNYAESYDSLVVFISFQLNYKYYRHALSTAEPPALPYLGLSLRDLTFIRDSAKNFMEVDPKDKLIYLNTRTAKNTDGNGSNTDNSSKNISNNMPTTTSATTTTTDSRNTKNTLSSDSDISISRNNSNGSNSYNRLNNNNNNDDNSNDRVSNEISTSTSEPTICNSSTASTPTTTTTSPQTTRRTHPSFTDPSTSTSPSTIVSTAPSTSTSTTATSATKIITIPDIPAASSLPSTTTTLLNDSHAQQRQRQQQQQQLDHDKSDIVTISSTTTLMSASSIEKAKEAHDEILQSRRAGQSGDQTTMGNIAITFDYESDYDLGRVGGGGGGKAIKNNEEEGVATSGTGASSSSSIPLEQSQYTEGLSPRSSYTSEQLRLARDNAKNSSTNNIDNNNDNHNNSENSNDDNSKNKNNEPKMNTRLINFTKRRKISTILRQVQQNQQMTFSFQRVEFMQKMLANFSYILNSETGWDRSVAIEPKCVSNCSCEKKCTFSSYKKKKMCFIVNSRARGGNAGRLYRRIHEKMDDIKNHSIDIVQIGDGVGGSKSIRQATFEAFYKVYGSAENYEVVVIIGGEGTINECLNIYVKENCFARGMSLCIIPVSPYGKEMEKGDDIVCPLGFPSGDADIVKVLRNYVTCDVDAGQVWCMKNGKQVTKWFINSCIMGQLDNTSRKGSPIDFGKDKLKNKVDQKVDYNVECLDENVTCLAAKDNCVAICNGNSYKLGKDVSDLTDGRFDVFSFDHRENLEIQRLRRKAKSPALIGQGTQYNVSVAKKCDNSAPVSVICDGEAIGQLPAKFKIHKGAIRLVMPHILYKTSRHFKKEKK